MKIDKIKKLESKIIYSVQPKEKDYSYLQDLSDQELNDLFNIEVAKLPHDPALDGLSERELSDLYFQQIQEGNRKNLR